MPPVSPEKEGQKHALPTILVKGPAGIIKINESDWEMYESQGYEIVKEEEEDNPLDSLGDHVVSILNEAGISTVEELKSYAEDNNGNFTKIDGIGDKTQKDIQNLIKPKKKVVKKKPVKNDDLFDE